jgi:hypothetical protein
MSGAPTPERVVEAFAAAAAPPYITLPIPVAADPTPGKASFDTGFPAITMTNPGGIPPSGADMNGILFTLSSWCAALQGGQIAAYDATAQTAFGGYKLGALLTKADGSGYWQSIVDANMTDPDTGGAGWVSDSPLWASTAAPAGAHNNFALPVPSDLVLDVDTSAGDTNFTGFVAGRDGQKIFLTNTGANLLTVNALDAGSTSANQVRIPTDFAIVQNQTLTLQYSTGATKWLAV